MAISDDLTLSAFIYLDCILVASSASELWDNHVECFGHECEYHFEVRYLNFGKPFYIANR